MGAATKRAVREAVAEFHEATKGMDVTLEAGGKSVRVSGGKQQVMDFATAKATAEEIREWRRDLANATLAQKDAKEVLENSVAWKKYATAKERVKDLQQRIDSAQAGLVDGLAAS